MATQKNLSTRWRRSGNEEDWQSSKKMILNNSTLLSLLDEILVDMQEAIVKEETFEDQYKSPSWAYLQAHRNGQKEMLKKLRELTQHT